VFVQVLSITKCKEGHDLIHHTTEAPSGSDVIQCQWVLSVLCNDCVYVQLFFYNAKLHTVVESLRQQSVNRM